MPAYAPCLEDHGIGKETFLDFIHSCNKAVQGSPVLAAVQVAAFGASFTPELIVMGVATAVQLGASAMNSASVRWKYVFTNAQYKIIVLIANLWLKNEHVSRQV